MVEQVNNIINDKSIVLYNSTHTNNKPTDLKIASGAIQLIFQTNAIVNKKGFKAIFSAGKFSTNCS